MPDYYLLSLSLTKCKPSWARVHFFWTGLHTVNGTIPPSLWPCVDVLLGGEQGRDGTFFQVQPFIFQAHLLPHNCFPVVAMAGEMQDAKSGGGGRPCPIRAMYRYHFRPFAGEWRVCGELVHRYSIVPSTWAPFSYTTIRHASSWWIWLLSNDCCLQRAPQLSAVVYNIIYARMLLCCHNSKWWISETNLPEVSNFPPNEGMHTTFNVILCSFHWVSTKYQFSFNMSVAL